MHLLGSINNERDNLKRLSTKNGNRRIDHQPWYAMRALRNEYLTCVLRKYYRFCNLHGTKRSKCQQTAKKKQRPFNSELGTARPSLKRLCVRKLLSYL